MSKTFIISGGGTGGHIFPALSIAWELQQRYPDAKIQFIGASGKMEMDRVPAAGFPILGVPIAGINRQKPWKSWNVPFKLIYALWRCRSIIRKLKPSVVIGTGGYASGPALFIAQRMGIPTLVQEQNSYAGITNIRLGAKASLVCTAYKNAERFFPTGKVRLTGNPIRKAFTNALPDAAESKQALGFDARKKVLLVLGGSLGARAINVQMAASMSALNAQGWQILWQCGKLYEEEYAPMATPQTHIQAFIDDMATAYAAADAIVSRAGAGTLSELCLVGKASVLIPSPNVAEDHQTHNARALSDKGAAVLIPERELTQRFEVELAALARNKARRDRLGENIQKLALPRATEDILDHIAALMK
jgi:UDP-N-acetylglucosamine--N-acetylmuramyl-(pentapeptide) pyrophosphoryl-undecaprenol N-acetylglucosamine transferase